ncbi:MAG TPA: 2-oxoacid:acceptor oxidoreductase family protein [Candidatus Binataceae bacterium]|nr:2-oxoacid:acceptor oxidoreductase family protein [Candidatus Binataceae bacterium]
MITNVRIAGVGGQGAVTAGQLLAEAAALDGLYATQSEAYTGIIRGGHAMSNVRISDEPIVFPWVMHSDYLVAMHQRALDAHLRTLSPGGVLIFDPVLVTKIPGDVDARVISVRILELAQRAGRNVVGNVVALAALARVSNLVTQRSVEMAVLRHVPKGTEDLNRRAVQLGFDVELDAAAVA